MAEQKLFNRKSNVVVDTVLISDLDIKFKVMKTLRKEPNTCEITIYNLSKSTRASLKSKGARVILQAGYENFIDTATDGVDVMTIVRCGDGERAYAFDRISESYKAGTKISTVLADVVAKLRVDPGNALQAIQGVAGNFLNGYVAHGKVGAELDRLLTGRGLEWSIQDGRLQLLAPNGATNVTTVLTKDTGLIGSPEYGTPDKKGKPPILKAKSLLQPQIKPGGRVKIQTDSIDSLFKVQTVTHEGETAGVASPRAKLAETLTCWVAERIH